MFLDVSQLTHACCFYSFWVFIAEMNKCLNMYGNFSYNSFMMMVLLIVANAAACIVCHSIGVVAESAIVNF